MHLNLLILDPQLRKIKEDLGCQQRALTLFTEFKDSLLPWRSSLFAFDGPPSMHACMMVSRSALALPAFSCRRHFHSEILNALLCSQRISGSHPLKPSSILDRLGCPAPRAFPTVWSTLGRWVRRRGGCWGTPRPGGRRRRSLKAHAEPRFAGRHAHPGFDVSGGADGDQGWRLQDTHHDFTSCPNTRTCKVLHASTPAMSM